MTAKGIKGYVLVTLTGLYVVAALILVLLNINKNKASFSWYGQNLTHSTGQLMIYSALVGFPIICSYEELDLISFPKESTVSVEESVRERLISTVSS